MKSALPNPPSFGRTVRLLLGAASKRAGGRRKRQQDLLYSRAGKQTTDWSRFGFLFTLFTAALNGVAAFSVTLAVQAGQRYEAERAGRMVVSGGFMDCAINAPDRSPRAVDQALAPHYSSEAENIAEKYGGSPVAIEQKLRQAARRHGSRGFVSENEASPGLTTLTKTGPFPAMLGSILLIWWAVMLAFQGEGLELDLQRRRSGEPEKVPRGRQWAAQLGMLTFGIGVVTQQWPIGVMGIVYSYVTAAAMWENFRARLPYLYDPWSEKLPPPPTLVHAMVAISILVEGGAVVTGIIIGVAGRANLAVAQALSYGVCAVIVSIGVSNFLDNRNVSLRDVWEWPTARQEESRPWWRGEGEGSGKLLRLLLVGAAGGVALGLFAHAYLAVLHYIPASAEILRKSQQELANIPNLKIAYAVMAVAFAPFAEEYLFRGLLFRALDREWGGWRAVVGSAAFFAIYHPPMSWLPVALVCADQRSAPWSAVAQLPPWVAARPPGRAARVIPGEKGGSSAAALQGGLRPQM